MEEQALLRLTLKRLNEQQRLWGYFQRRGFKLPIEFDEKREEKVLRIELDNDVVVNVKTFLVEKFNSNHMQMRSLHNDIPTIKRKENLVEIEFKTSTSALVFLRSFPKDQELKIARLEMWTNTWRASHEFPLELLPHVKEKLEKAISTFGWETE